MLDKSLLLIAENILIILDQNTDLKIIFKSKTYTPTIEGFITKKSDENYYCCSKLDNYDSSSTTTDRNHIIHKIANLYMDDDFIIDVV
jgi:hypothetical protein